MRNVVDEMKEPTYKRNEANSLLANFSCMMHLILDPFISKLQQVFYLDAHIIGLWHVVFHSKPRSKRTQVLEYRQFTNTKVCVPTLELEALFSPTFIVSNMVGVITLEKNTKLAHAPLQKKDFGNMLDED